MATGSEQHARRGRGRGGRRTNGGRTTSGRVASKGAKGASSSQERRVEALADELGNLAERLGIRVRREKLLREVGYRARGGFCRVGGAPVLILDSESPGEARLDLLLDVLGGRDLSGLEISKEARGVLASARRDRSTPPSETASTAAPLPPADPGDGSELPVSVDTEGAPL